jgi:hypothetical protein
VNAGCEGPEVKTGKDREPRVLGLRGDYQKLNAWWIRAVPRCFFLPL